MRWVKQWWWLLLIILAITSVIWCKEERCQSQANQCRATYEAQAQYERLSSSRVLTVDQRATEQRAIGAACEPNGYLCRLFGAANLPTVVLVFIGIGGIWAALWTLKAIQRQADIQEAPLQQWIAIDKWGTEGTHNKDGSAQLRIFFSVVNPTPYPLSLTRISVEIREVGIDYPDGHPLGPGERRTLGIEIHISESETKQRLNGALLLVVQGYVKFIGVLKKEMVWPLTGLLQCSQQQTIFTPEFRDWK
jgi:hypothetical protein